MNGSNIETKKVFGSLKGITVALAFASFGIIAGLHPINSTLLICGSFFGIFTILGIYFRFQPFFSYNDQYFIRADIRKGFRGAEEISWEDIISITTHEYSFMTFINPRNGNVVPMNILITPNYYQTLEEMVALLQRNNPKAKINAATFKVLDKSYQRKQTYLLILLLLILVLILALAKFHWLDIG